MLIPTIQFVQIVGIGFDRFEQRRVRERSSAKYDTMSGDDLARMPITPIEHGHRAFYDVLDTVRLRAVVELENCGMAFGAACLFLSRAGLGPEFLFDEGRDFFAAQWISPDGTLRRVSGSELELRRAMPEAPHCAVRLNLSAIRDDVAVRAVDLGLTVVRGEFEEVAK